MNTKLLILLFIALFGLIASQEVGEPEIGEIENSGLETENIDTGEGVSTPVVENQENQEAETILPEETPIEAPIEEPIIEENQTEESPAEIPMEESSTEEIPTEEFTGEFNEETGIEEPEEEPPIVVVPVEEEEDEVIFEEEQPVDVPEDGAIIVEIPTEALAPTLPNLEVEMNNEGLDGENISVYIGTVIVSLLVVVM